MAELDQTARFALQLDPAESMRWLEPTLDEDLPFARWLDTRMIAFPGEPKRRCDTVAELVSRSGGQAPWALIVEVEARPRAGMTARLLEYVGRALRKLRHGPNKRDRYQVAAVLIYLTGKKKRLRLRMRLPGTQLGMGWNVGVMSLARKKASVTLRRIAEGKLGLSILPWVPLMADGGTAEVVQEWVRLARTETSEERRTSYVGLALVFAERAGCLPAWQQATEELNVAWKSQVIEGWRTEGRGEGRLEEKRAVLLKVLAKRFKSAVPADLTRKVEETTDLDALSRWLDAALEEPTLDAFRSAIQSAPPPSQANGTATAP